MELIDVIEVRNRLAEGVLWNNEDKRAWWTDIADKQLLRYRLQTRELEKFDLPEKLGSFAFVRNSRRILGAFESGFAFYEPETGALEWVARPPHAQPGIRMNDGRVDRQGRFWAGSMNEDWRTPLGRLYRLDANGDCTTVAQNIAIPNSLCFSPDGRRMYFSDSPNRIIHCYDIDAASGEISNKRVFAITPEGEFPDGAQVDSTGHVWCAHWNGSKVVRYAPNGEVDCKIDLPVTGPTCVAFGGEDLNLLFVTTTRDGLGDDEMLRQPLAGSLFVFKVPVSGLVDARFNWKPPPA
ncbi:MAG: SMP-30/gluconolactonase/LRE family protein [Proteobacteria bacterium]|nr:SMP-30/gluconolactonase/LRE family protein [Pseudomonadota bacterium]